MTGLPADGDAVGGAAVEGDAVGGAAVEGDAVEGDAVEGATNGPIPGMTVGEGPTQAEGQSFFEAVGGHQTFGRIVRSFYDSVAGDPVLGRMYPADDMDGAVERLTLFLEQYWGGPTTYSDRRGHPRLRMRHAGFHVNPEARDHWVSLMRAAVEGAGLSPLHQATLLDYLERAAHSMINTFEPTPER